MENLREKLVVALKPIYEDIISNLEPQNTTFFMQIGDKFPIEENKGIVFAGRSVNGWLQGENTTFENIIKYRMSFWENSHKGKKTRSQFIRLAKKISVEIYHDKEEWYKNIAWSNLHKVSPKKEGNPSEELKRKYKDICLQIFEKEIEVLTPKIVVLLTGWSWAKPFLLHLNNNNDIEESQKLEKVTWNKNKNFVAKAIEINKTIYILSEHPQGKIEYSHVNAILELIKKYQ